MRFLFLFLFLFLWGLGFLFFSGCHEHPHQNETRDEPHLQAYLKLKKKSPDSALIELKAHANITFKAHPRANDWAELAARLDRAGKASLPDMQRLSQLVLEMARKQQGVHDIPSRIGRQHPSVERTGKGTEN